MKKVFSNFLCIALSITSMSCATAPPKFVSSREVREEAAAKEVRMPASVQAPALTSVVIDAKGSAAPFPHFWDRIFGSGRAILATRESYRNDLREVKKATNFGYARFHEILSDEVGVYDEDDKGNARYNFTYVDDIYDGLLNNGVRPFVELSYMPSKLAARPDDRVLWNMTGISPPKDYKKWEELIRNFTQHLVDRYGIDEVSQWYFEVWNEAEYNWSGKPPMETYFELYSHTAPMVKAVSPKLRVGGPSTAAGHWITEFLNFTAKNRLPVDFVSTHAYADDSAEGMFGDASVPRHKRVCLAIKNTRDKIKASHVPNTPLMWTEWSVPGFGNLHGRDTTYVAAGLAETVKQCDGLVDMMSYWTFSDVFDEAGVMQGPFTGWFGIMTVGGIKKPGYYGFKLLHRLGEKRLPNSSPNVIVTRRADNGISVAAWNLVALDEPGPVQQKFNFQFNNMKPNSSIHIIRVDENHSNTLGMWKRMGSPMYPSKAQVEEMNRNGELVVEKAKLVNGKLELDIPPNGLVLIETPKVK